MPRFACRSKWKHACCKSVRCPGQKRWCSGLFFIILFLLWGRRTTRTGFVVSGLVVTRCKKSICSRSEKYPLRIFCVVAQQLEGKSKLCIRVFISARRQKHAVLLVIYQTFCAENYAAKSVQIIKSIYPTLRNKKMLRFIVKDYAVNLRNPVTKFRRRGRGRGQALGIQGRWFIRVKVGAKLGNILLTHHYLCWRCIFMVKQGTMIRPRYFQSVFGWLLL